MKTLDHFIPEGVKKERLEGITEITRIMRPLIAKTVNEIFIPYKLNLLTEPIDYIIPAVWGTKKNGELDDTQKRIHKQCIPVIKTLFDSLRLKDLSAPRRFAIEFLIRELLISKIAFMIEGTKSMMINQLSSSGQDGDSLMQNEILSHLDPLGNA